MSNETFLFPLVGGIIISLSTSLLLFFNGKICGISGILGGLLKKIEQNDLWKISLVAGLILGSFIFSYAFPQFFKYSIDLKWWEVLVGGFLVGLGTRVGGGCTSGHGVCGISRFSPRSILATVLFILAGIFTVYLKGLF